MMGLPLLVDGSIPFGNAVAMHDTKTAQVKKALAKSCLSSIVDGISVISISSVTLSSATA
jgi:hypothetical protein